MPAPAATQCNEVSRNDQSDSGDPLQPMATGQAYDLDALAGAVRASTRRGCCPACSISSCDGLVRRRGGGRFVRPSLNVLVSSARGQRGIVLKTWQ